MLIYFCCSFASLFDVLGIEPTLPRYLTLEEQKKLYNWTSYPKNEDGTPADCEDTLSMDPGTGLN